MLYDSAVEDLSSPTVRFTEILPFEYLKAEALPFPITDRSQFVEMTDDELDLCLDLRLLPAFPPIGELHQVESRTALRVVWDVPKATTDEKADARAAAEISERIAETATSILLVLRLLKGERVGTPGHVVTTDTVYARHRPILWSLVGSSLLNRMSSYPLSVTDGASLLELWSEVHSDRVRDSKTYRVALRRFSRSAENEGEDGVIDLVTAAEALFLPRENIELAYKLALRGAAYLREVRDPRTTYSFLRNAYNARSKLVHGEELPRLKRLDGTGTDDIEEFTGELAQIMRVALRKTLKDAVAGNEVTDWDEFVLGALVLPSAET